MSLLNNKTIIITGGSLGIGLAISKKCAHEGATVIIVARNQHDLENSLNDLRKISDKPHNCYKLDVSNYDKVIQFKEWIEEIHLEINGLVNCAGVYGPIGKTTEIDMAKFVEAININFIGTVQMCNQIAPLIASKSRKKIVNFSGGGAATPFANYSAYAASKIAVVRFTENLAIELSEDKYDINCVAPGFVITRLHQETIEKGVKIVGNAFYESTKNQMKSGGVPPEKAADLTAFLLSGKSDGISGKFISAPWDPWQAEEFQEMLRNDKDFATLRRIDNKTYCKKI